MNNPGALVRAYGQAWASRQGGTLSVDVYDSRQELPASADVWVLHPAGLPREAAAGGLLPLPESFTGQDTPFAWSDLLPGYRSQLLNWGRSSYGVPLTGEAPLCCYRLDRFQGRNPPSTWEQFAEAAEAFRGPGGEPSLPALPADEQALDRLFWTVAANYARRAVPTDEPTDATHLDDIFSFYFDLNTGNPRINGPGFIHALELLQRLQRCRPKKPAEIPEQDFLAGKAVLCVTDACWVAEFQKKGTGLENKVGVCRVPGAGQYYTVTGEVRRAAEGNRVPYLGGAGWLAVVPKTAEHPAAAFDLLGYLAGPQTSGQMMLAPRWGTGPTREEQLRNERWDAFDLDTAMTGRLRDVLQEELLHRHMKNPLICLRIPDEAAYREALHAELRRALEDSVSARDALDTAAQMWGALAQKHGLAAHRAAYRLSLGLLGG
jgi:ABC-type glycerol-3-phosphate transport system substrate-binding protein